MGCLSDNIEPLGREIPIGAKWKFEVRTSRWPERMLTQIKQYINYLPVYEHAERAAVAEYIMASIRDLYWDFWGMPWDVSTADCTIFLQDYGGNCYQVVVEGPGPKDVSVPISFSLKLWPSYQETTNPNSIR